MGNVMIDSLVRLLPIAQKTKIDGLPERYALVTLHSPANVDDSVRLKGILESLLEVNRDLAVVFPGTSANPQADRRFWIECRATAFARSLPICGVSRIAIACHGGDYRFGGIQEETTYLGVPCLTVRENTERPITVSMGTNVLVGRDPEKLRMELSRVLGGKAKEGSCAAALGRTRRGAHRRHSRCAPPQVKLHLNRYRNPWFRR